MKVSTVKLLIPALILVFAGTVAAQVPELIGTIEGSLTEDRGFGDESWRLATGDVNGDGYTDLIVGSWGRDLVRIFFGDELGIDTEPGVTLQAPEAGKFFGAALSVGDLNNDDFDDVVVGAFYGSVDTLANAGKAYVYLGGSPMDTTIDLTLASPNAIEGGRFGIAVRCLNFEGDPYTDVFISASREHVYGSQPVPYPGVSPAIPTYSGITYLFRGGGTLNAEADLIIAGEGGSGKAGEKGMDVADVNGDGYDDLLVDAYGARYNSANTADNSGKVNLYLGGTLLDFAPDIRIPKQDDTITEMFAYAMSTGGDINGDGLDDLLVGRHAGGKIYIYFGPLRCLDPDLTIEAPAEAVAATWAQKGINELGDINDDGYDDFIVSGYMDGWEDGVAYIFLGGETTGGYLALANPDAGSMGRFSLASAPLGDINGDEIDDFLLSAPAYGDSTQGKLYLYAGSTEITTGLKAQNISIPSSYSLKQNYPNPFNPETTIDFSLPKAGKVTLKIYNTLGQEVKTLVDKKMNVGYHRILWDGTDYTGQSVASGIYFYRIKISEHVSGKRMLLIR